MRDNRIDVLKGMAILFVIYYHILWAAVGFKTSPTVVLFDSCCMQLFFFISGFLSYKPITNKEIGCYIKSEIFKKVKNILVPTILMFLFSIWFFNLDLLYWCKNNFHNGYWFTFVLFLIFVCHYLFVLPLEARHNRKWIDAIISVVLFLLMICSVKIDSYINNDISHILSLSFVLKYWFFFNLGYLLSKYTIILDPIIDKTATRVLLFILAIIPLHLFDENIKRYLLECVVSPARVIVIFYLVKKSMYFCEEKLLSKTLVKLGRHSLEIYFLHYYFIFGMPLVLDLLTKQLDMYVVRGPGSTITLELLIIIPISVLIAYLCMLTRAIINYAPPHLGIVIWKNT